MGTIIYPKRSPVLLIDTSYYIFYRYYATYNWYRRQHDAVEVSQLMSESKFLDKYKTMFEKTLLNLCKLYKITDFRNIVFATDCMREQIWRHKHYNAYKATRDDRSDSFNREIFVYTYHNVLPYLEATYNTQSTGHKHLEADDIIAVLTKELCAGSLHAPGDDTVYITIITNDNDYVQLLDHPAIDTNKAVVSVKNLMNKDLLERVGYSPRVYLKVKTILGDKSDNIPSIVSKCGDKTAFKLATSEDKLQTLLDESSEAKSQYMLNQLLIDFDNIPKSYQEEVMQDVVISNTI